MTHVLLYAIILTDYKKRLFEEQPKYVGIYHMSGKIKLFRKGTKSAVHHRLQNNSEEKV